jgi:hypothetical protein
LISIGIAFFKRNFYTQESCSAVPKTYVSESENGFNSNADLFTGVNQDLVVEINWPTLIGDFVCLFRELLVNN